MAKKKILMSRIALLFLFIMLLLLYLGFPFDASSYKGSQETTGLYKIPGLSVLVKSSGNWDLFEYLCKKGDDCEATPTSGLRLSTISGGEDQEHEVVIDQAREWSDYSYIKLFVRSAINEPEKIYKVEKDESLPQAEVKNIGEGRDQVEAVVVPVSEVSNSYHEMAVTFKGN